MVNAQEFSAFIPNERAKIIFAHTIHAAFQPTLPFFARLKLWLFGIKPLS